MPEKKTLERARKDKSAGKSPSTQAGEFVREAMEHAREGKLKVKSPKQAIAIGLSEARRAGVDVKPPQKGKATPATRKKAQRDVAKGKSAATSTRKAAHASGSSGTKSSASKQQASRAK